VLARLDAVGRDRDAVRALTADLLRRVTGSRSHAAHSLADAVDQAPASRLLSDLRVGLEELAAPLHLERGDPLVTPASAPPGPQQATRLMPVVREAEVPMTPRIPAARDPERHRWRAAVRTGAHGLRAYMDALPAGRRRLVVGAGAAVTAAALLLALPRPPAAEPATSSPASGPGVWTARAEPTDRSDLSEPSTGSVAADAAIGGDDPLAAAVALLERRQTCFAELSLLCLEEVDQQGSAALLADRTVMEALRAGEEADVTASDGSDPRLAERWGDSALVEVGPETAPAPLLLMRSEAGWRIRDWIAGSPD